jgi:streptomycin 6-kinase
VCRGNLRTMFDRYLTRWALTPDGHPIITRTSHLFPVRQQGVPAMLKVAVDDEERLGGLLMVWWDGQGAAPVLAYDTNAILLERAEGREALTAMAEQGHDENASRIICAVVAELHAPRVKPLPNLVSLTEWFSELEPAAASHGGIFASSATVARELLTAPREVRVLHGDIHHANILDFGPKGWLAIDPKGPFGERGFDYANLFCNPTPEVALQSGRFARQVELVAAVAGLDRVRLLQWILAGSGLSAAWHLKDGERLDSRLAIARMALACLQSYGS